MTIPIVTDSVRLSALGQLLYKKPVEHSPSDIPSELEKDIMKIEGVSVSLKVTPVYQLIAVKKERVELHDYQGNSIDKYI